jgi:hypothetical protein
MIRQKDRGGVWLFPQTAHAFMCGQLALQWIGSPLEPANEMLYAIANHDAGWLERDREPQINEEGKPRTFTELDLSDHFATWTRSIERASGGNRYAGLIVSLHATNLYEKRLRRDRDSASTQAKIGNFVDSWSAEQEKTRAELAPYYGALVENERLTHNREMLQAFDWMSLMLCMGGPREEHSFPAGENGPITATVDAANILTLKPWFFANDNLTVTVEGRYLNQQVFATDAILRDHYDRAPNMMCAFRVVSGE